METSQTPDRMSELEQKIDAIYISVEKTRKYFLVVMWVSLAMVVLPALGLLLVIPKFLSIYTTELGGF